MDNQTYKKYAEGRAKKSPLGKDMLSSFICGGLICTIGHGLKQLYMYLGLAEETAGIVVTVSLIFIAVLLTGIGVFDKFASVAGAGALVPVTGFANAVAAPAIDTKTEGYVLGVGARIFIIAGPVILYGLAAGSVYGVIYYFWNLIM